jgi:hypothetical protein
LFSHSLKIIFVKLQVQAQSSTITFDLSISSFFTISFAKNLELGKTAQYWL